MDKGWQLQAKPNRAAAAIGRLADNIQTAATPRRHVTWERFTEQGVCGLTAARLSGPPQLRARMRTRRRPRWAASAST